MHKLPYSAVIRVIIPAIVMSIRHVFIFTFFFHLLIPVTFSLSFNLSTIGTQSSRFIKFTGDAYISDQGIQVTPDERNKVLVQRAGRATYIEPLHLWDQASGNLADFSTHFSFVIDSDGARDLKYADGLAFFLAPLASTTIKPWSNGGSLGLGNGSSPVNSFLDSFVAVEFDTYQNKWDPPSKLPHVGININSMMSVTTATWNNNITDGVQNNASISYNASSKILRVEFTGYSSNGTQQGNLSYFVDLREHLPENVTIGFSATSGYLFQKNIVKSWDFFSSLNGSTSKPHELVDTGGKDSKGNKKGLIVGSSVGLSILILASAFASYGLWKKKYKMESGDEDSFDSSMDNEFEMGTGPKKFPYSELVHATKNFAEEEKLGEGGFGGVYRGLLRETNSYIAVKRVSKGSKQGLKEYASEVKIISQLRHRNLVQLIGWCHERRELLIVYEFMPNGSLDSHLFKAKSVLTWQVRYKIAQGLASALLYLHEEWERCVVHRDIKASNIMLDSNFNAKLGDFGLARLVDHEKGSQTTVLAGTVGYMAPEYRETCRASKESDIYSFGIVLLEISCGRRPIDHRCQENQVILVEWVWSLYGAGKLLDAADPKLESEYDEQEIEQVMVVGLWCAHPDSSQRPSIRQAIQVLNSEAQLPTLPSMMPVATYNYTPTITRVPKSSNANSEGVSESVAYGYYSNSSKMTTSSACASATLPHPHDDP